MDPYLFAAQAQANAAAAAQYYAMGGAGKTSVFPQ